MRRRSPHGVLSIYALAMAAALVLGVSSSRASVSPAPYLDAAYDDPFWALVGGQTWPDTFPAEWAASSAEEVSVAAGAMPALESLGTIALGIAALDIGWKIGRQIDTRWLHLSCRAADTCGDAQGSGFANTTISGLWWKRFNCSTPITGTFCIWAYNNGVLTQNADGTYGVWMYQWSSSGWPPYRCNTCDTFVKSNGAICGSNAGCVAAQYFANKHLTLGFAAGPWATGSNCDGGVPGAQCYVWVATYAQMDAALVHSLSVPYTNQPVNRTTNISAPVNTSAALEAARAKLGSLGPAAQNEVNAALDPTNWARPGENGSPPGGLISDWTMPDCLGLTVTSCESSISSAAAAANAGSVTFSVATAAIGAADLAIAAGLTVSTSPAAGQVGRPMLVAVTKNPDPLPILWPAAALTETYDQYVSRLRSLGWLGSATISSLNSIEGDPRRGVGGVPCTSSQEGTRIWPEYPVTFFQNPTTAFSDAHGSDGGACGGGFATPATEADCEFNDEITNDPAKGSWQQTEQLWGPYVLDAECVEAWHMMKDLGLVNVDGSLTSAAIEGALDMDLRILNPQLQAELPSHGASIEFWRKVYLDSFAGTSFVTQLGNRFELHFYRDVSGNAYTAKDFKIVFLDWFH